MGTDFDVWDSAVVANDVLLMAQAPARLLQARQRERLTATVAAARRDTRLHAERLRGLVDDAPLEALPVLTRSQLMARFDDAVADPRLTLAGVRDFVAEPSRIGTPLLGRYTVWESSGTSGQPGYFVQDPHAMAVYDALEALRRPGSAGAAGWPWWPWQGPRMAFVGATGGHFASNVSGERLRRLNPWLGLTLRSFSILQPLPALVAALNDWAPSTLGTYPTAAVMLADEQRRGRLRLALAELMTGGETLDAAQRAHIEAGFGCRVRNSYGASEFLSIAGECRAGRLHLNADWTIVEPVDGAGRPVPPGELSERVLLTHLANRVQPLIRYDLGDRVRVLAGSCACGSALPAIEVLGRHDDVLRLRAPNGRRVTLLPLALSTVLEEEAGVFDFQLLQRDAHTLALRLGEGELRSRLPRCHEALQRFARTQGLAGLRIVDQDGPPCCGRSGKLQRVVALAGAAGC